MNFINSLLGHINTTGTTTATTTATQLTPLQQQQLWNQQNALGSLSIQPGQWIQYPPQAPPPVYIAPIPPYLNVQPLPEKVLSQTDWDTAEEAAEKLMVFLKIFEKGSLAHVMAWYNGPELKYRLTIYKP